MVRDLPGHRLRSELCNSQRVLSFNEGLIILPIPGSGQGEGQGRVDSLAHQADSHRLKVRNLDVEKLLDAIRSPRYYLCTSKATIMMGGEGGGADLYHDSRNTVFVLNESRHASCWKRIAAGMRKDALMPRQSAC